MRPFYLLIALIGAGVASAQDAPRLAPVVVTATRTAQSPYDIPAAIDSVATPPDGTLDVNLSERLQSIPGVTARDRQNYAQDTQISIRGFGARSTFGIRGIRLYTDGIPATMPDGQGQVTHFNLDSAERVEVLRGPFSALYGNASGGVIQLFTADGTEPPELRFGTAGGSNGNFRASVNARGVEGPVDYNVDVSHFRTSGYRDHSAARRESGNAKIGWQIDDDRKLTLVLNAVDIPGAQDPLGLTRAQYKANPRQVAAVADSFDTRKSADQQQAGLIYEQRIDAANSLRVMGYYGQRSVTQYLSIPVATQRSQPGNAGGVVDLSNQYGGGDVRWTWHDTLAGRPFEIATGIAYDNQHQHREGYENFVGNELGVRGRKRRDEIDRVFDFDQYAQATWRVANDWTLMGGVRHSEVRFRSDDRYISPGNPDDSGTVKYSATTPVFGVLWRAAPWAHVYANWGRGFETPTFSEIGYRADGGAGLAFNLKPSRSKNMEVGVKLQPTERIRAGVALFRADSDDELAVTTNQGGRTTYQNIARSRRQGIEASFDGEMAKDLHLIASYTRLQATFRSPFMTCVATPCVQAPVAAGTRIPGVPRSMGYAALKYGAEKGWQVGIDMNAMGATSVNDLGTESAPGYALFGLSGGYVFDQGPWRVNTFARVDNLADRHVIGSVIVNDGNGRYYEPAPGRTFLVGVDVRWR
ncbi:MAG: Fe(3+) dicitrate transport protein FecA [Luteibacter sp.]|uniref:TonB-dependent receptor family protein n=1 Tax=Luteibacter sp. TaxID=1886636 RepID=UPI0013829A03|nr:TonB-dependent receptor [Luteibacter sp.]KAF1007728.1 MAG: Fe(3+) dicitrate transport protein FecA [Luteibacter sp.]